MRFSRTLILAAALGTAGIMGMGPASAAPAGVAQVAGTGTILPGLPTTGCDWQHVTFDGTAVAAGAETGTFSVHFDGDSTICETLQAGKGGGTLSGGLAGSVSYLRTGNAVQLTGNVTVNGHTYTIGTNAFVFVPTSANPTKSYALSGTVELDS